MSQAATIEASIDQTGIDPTSIDEAVANPATYADPALFHPLFARLRRDEPVRWTTPSTTRPFWLLSKHADIVEISRQPQKFLSGPRLELQTIAQEDAIRAANGGDKIHRSMLDMDGAEHKAHRGMTQSWFMPANLRKLEAGIAEQARLRVDSLAAAGDGPVDFIQLVSEIFPLQVILMILGLPPEEAPHLLKLTHDFTRRETAAVPPGTSRDDILVNATHAIFDYFGKIYDDRLNDPREDVASVIAHARIDGQPVARFEAMSYYLLLGLAGHDTTNGTIAGGILALIENPGELAKLRADPDLIKPAIDEFLRWETVTKTFMRTAAEDYVLRGRTIRAGDALLLSYNSGNFDEEAFGDPFTFRVDRTPNPHLTFGHGAHKCLGMHLARMEMEALFRELLGRLDSIELAEPPARPPSIVTASIMERLMVRCRVRAG